MEIRNAGDIRVDPKTGDLFMSRGDDSDEQIIPVVYTNVAAPTEGEPVNAKQRRKKLRQELQDLNLQDVIDFPVLDDVRKRTILVRLSPKSLPWERDLEYDDGGLDTRIGAFSRAWGIARVRLQHRAIHCGYFLGVGSEHPLYDYYVIPIARWATLDEQSIRGGTDGQILVQGRQAPFASLKTTFENLREKGVETRQGSWGIPPNREHYKEALFVEWELATLDEATPRIDDPQRGALYWYMLGDEDAHIRNDAIRNRLATVLRNINSTHNPNFVGGDPREDDHSGIGKAKINVDAPGSFDVEAFRKTYAKAKDNFARTHGRSFDVPDVIRES